MYNSDIHNYNTRSTVSQGLFIPEISTTNYGKKSIKYQGPLIWNKLSKNLPPINEVHSTNKFKNTIKIYSLSVNLIDKCSVSTIFHLNFIIIVIIIINIIIYD